MCLIAEVHEEIAGLLSGPVTGRMQRDAEDADPPGRVFYHGQNVGLGACAGRKLGYRFWPGLSRGGPVLVEQSAQTLSASDPVDPGRERDHVRFVFGSRQKHSVALAAAPGVVMADVDVEHVV